MRHFEVKLVTKVSLYLLFITGFLLLFYPLIINNLKFEFSFHIFINIIIITLTIIIDLVLDVLLDVNGVMDTNINIGYIIIVILFIIFIVVVLIVFIVVILIVFIVIVLIVFSVILMEYII